jgi:hypothetical protein
VTPEDIATALHRTPLRSIAEMRDALAARPRAHGSYAWWLIDADAPPEVPATPHPTEPAALLYVGIGPGGPRSGRRALRDRFNDHTQRNTGNSTFRLDLAALLFEREGWRPVWTDRAQLPKEDNGALTAWQATNLRAQWIEVSRPWESEPAVIALMRPPLNRAPNATHPFSGEVGRARERYRAAARANAVAAND